MSNHFVDQQTLIRPRLEKRENAMESAVKQ